MATLNRVTGKVFGSNAPLNQIGQFGSALAGTPTNTQDVATIQALDAYLNGWGSAVISSRNFPPIEEVNGVLKTISYQNCYLLQEGIPAYDVGTEYSNTSIVKSISGTQLTMYISLQNNNIGHSLTDTDYWAQVTFIGSSAIGAPQITLNFNAVLPDNCIWLEGAEINRTTYSTLFGIYGTTYGEGDGSTTFNLPDCRNRVFWGGENAGYIEAGLPNLVGWFQGAGHGAGYCDGALFTARRNGVKVSNDGEGDYTYNFNASNYNGMYGNSTTVQPPAIKVRVYTRYK